MSKKSQKAKTPQRKERAHVVSFRVDDDTLARLDSYAESLRAAAPGASWSRSSAALNLVVQGLNKAVPKPT